MNGKSYDASINVELLSKRISVES